MNSVNDFTTILCDVMEYDSAEKFQRFAGEKNVKCIMGLHVLKAGKLLLGKLD